MSNGKPSSPSTPAYRPQDPFSATVPRSAELVPSSKATVPLPSKPKPIRVDPTHKLDEAQRLPSLTEMFLPSPVAEPAMTRLQSVGQETNEAVRADRAADVRKERPDHEGGPSKVSHDSIDGILPHFGEHIASAELTTRRRSSSPTQKSLASAFPLAGDVRGASSSIGPSPPPSLCGKLEKGRDARLPGTARPTPVLDAAQGLGDSRESLKKPSEVPAPRPAARTEVQTRLLANRRTLKTDTVSGTSAKLRETADGFDDAGNHDHAGHNIAPGTADSATSPAAAVARKRSPTTRKEKLSDGSIKRGLSSQKAGTKEKPSPQKGYKTGGIPPNEPVSLGDGQELRKCGWRGCPNNFIVPASRSPRRFCSNTCRARASDDRMGKVACGWARKRAKGPTKG